MKFPLKNMIASRFITKSGRNNTRHLLKISKTGTGINSVLIILPIDNAFVPLAQHLLKSLSTGKGLEISKNILIWKGQMVLIDDEHSDIIEFPEEEFSRFGIPPTDFVNQVTANKFSAVVDLNPDFNPASLFIVNSVNAPLKIGFDVEHGDKILNILIDPKGTNFIEKGYDHILDILGL